MSKKRPPWPSSLPLKVEKKGSHDATLPPLFLSLARRPPARPLAGSSARPRSQSAVPSQLSLPFVVSGGLRFRFVSSRGLPSPSSCSSSSAGRSSFVHSLPQS